MNASRKPRHVLALIVALTAFAAAMVQLADRSGEPPRWRRTAVDVLLPLSVCLVAWNTIKDRRQSKAAAQTHAHGTHASRLDGDA